MRGLLYIFFSLSVATIFYGCSKSAYIKENENTLKDSAINGVITRLTDTTFNPKTEIKKFPCDIAGADSLESFIYDDGNREKLLFSIVRGGNIVCLNDSIIDLNNAKYALFTIADYGQEDQIYYLIYDIGDEYIRQSERINLPSLGLNIKSYRQISPIAIDSDSVSIKVSDTERNIQVGLTHLDCDSAMIINYYEYK